MARATVGYSQFPDLLDELHRTRQWAFAVLVASRMLLYLTVALGTLLIATLIQGFLHPGIPIKWFFCVTVLATSVGGIFAFVVPSLFRTWTYEQIAVKIERRYPELDNKIINAVLLAQDEVVEPSGLVEKLVEDALKDLSLYDLRKCVDMRDIKRWGISTCVVSLAVLLYASLSWDRFSSSLNAIFHPTKIVAIAGSVRIVSVQPGNTAVLSGKDVSVTLKTQGAKGKGAEILYRAKGQQPVKRPMFSVSEDEFVYALKEIVVPTEYQVMIGGSSSEMYAIRVVERPVIERIDIGYKHPQYTKLPPRREDGVTGTIRCVVGTSVTVYVHSSKPLETGKLAMLDGTSKLLTPDKENRNLASSTFTVLKDGAYTINIVDKDGIQNDDPVVHPITAVPDRPPVAQFVKPGQDVTITLGETVKLVLEANDDYGVEEVKLFEKRSDGSPQKIVKTWRGFVNPVKPVVVYDWKFAAETYETGDLIEYYAVVTDNNEVATQPGRTETGHYKVKIEDKSKAKAEKERAVAEWEKKLNKILEDQKAAREFTNKLKDEKRLALQRTGIASVKEKQSLIRRETLVVAGEITQADDRATVVKASLYKLTANEMAKAVQIPESLAEEEKEEVLKKGMDEEVSVQTKIIRTLEKILDVLPELSEAPKAEKREDEAFDISETARKKLEELKDALKDFVEEQKKVVEATNDLAKKPVDDFTQEDEQKLADAKATEDKWSKFLKEAHSDLSKLPEQDFSNPSLLDELIEVTSEVEMAKGALEKKATEIATSMEDGGAELAKALTTHIEKWLPDTPDRTKWAMEEPVGDKDIPMAELPKELEDLVGDLMEQQEDLFEDMEDATSSWADSIDKGAGWDAADGPISNMSAQGVTGNQLPNNSEIGGRSGEGRTGKSSGEFVEKTATGKGGRDTPTRLTPDPFEQGEVDDQSKDPSGGSTGGGKVSGAGGLGLEGPTPPDLKKKLEAIGGRQAELRNKAEKIAIEFKIRNYPSLFDQAVTDMKELESDLKSGRYHNVLRKKSVVLKNLSQTRMFLQGEVEMNRDRSASLPDYLQDEILDAMGGDAPQDYKELLKSYYEALSKTK